VNQKQGLEQIQARHAELAAAAQEALAPVQELTARLQTTEPVPEGMVKGTLYKLKKKFL
jgi:methyl-accepting chemotaxis protein